MRCHGRNTIDQILDRPCRIIIGCTESTNALLARETHSDQLVYLRFIRPRWWIVIFLFLLLLILSLLNFLRCQLYFRLNFRFGLRLLHRCLLTATCAITTRKSDYFIPNFPTNSLFFIVLPLNISFWISAAIPFSVSITCFSCAICITSSVLFVRVVLRG